MAHESAGSYPNESRHDVLEGGLGGQERTLAVLLEQAFSIKQEVAAGLQSTKGSIQVEAMSRKLLESHILTITRIVMQLSDDIQTLEKQITQHDSATSGTSHSVDQKHLAGIGDLRGRVARCDASISKLSTAVSSGDRHMMRLKQETKELRAAVDVKLRELDIKLHRDLGRLEASLMELTQSSTTDLQKQVQALDNKVSAGGKEANGQIDSLRTWTEQQLLTVGQAQGSQQLCSTLQNKMSESESRFSLWLRALEARVEQCETRRDADDCSQGDRLKRCETKLGERMSRVEGHLHQELQLLKHEYHKGFHSVHDAIESLRQIGDFKSRLDKDELQREIRQHLQSAAPDQ